MINMKYICENLNFKKINYYLNATKEISRFIELAHIKKQTMILFVLSLLMAIFGVITSVFFGRTVDQLLMKKGHSIIFNTLIIYLCLRLISIIIEALLNLLSGHTRNKLIYVLRNETLRKLIVISYERFQAMKHGDLLGKIQESTFDLGDNLGIFLPEVIRRILITMVVTLVIIVSNPLIGFVLIVMIITMFYLQISAGSCCDDFMDDMVHARNERNALAHGVISNALTIQIFDKNKVVPVWLEIAQSNYIKKFTNAMTRLVLVFSPAKVMNELVLIFICLLISYINKDNATINIASFISLTTLIAIVTNEMKGLDSVLSNLPMLLANINDLNEIYNSETIDKFEVKLPSKNSSVFFTNAININKLCFSYSNGKNILCDLTLKVSRGEKIAIVGDNGCGKSTLLTIISGIYPNYTGTINLFGEELNSIRKNDLSKYVGYASQESMLFNDSIFNNIKMGNKSIDEKTIEKILYRLNLGYIIEGKLLYVNNYVQKLSVGERQRIVLARLIVRESPIILLDEAISGLDDNIARETIKLLLENTTQTTFFTIHKLEYTKCFDRIVVMQEGQIIESGSFHELLNNKSYFFERYERERNDNEIK